MFDPEIVAVMKREYLFFVGLIDNLNDPKKYLANMFESFKPIRLPYAPNIEIIGVDLDNIAIKNSYTKPVIIPFITTQGTIRLLFKKESIMNDVIVLNLMTLCDIILNEHLGSTLGGDRIGFGVVVYPTMPLTANSGMIEIIENAETVYEIINKKRNIFKHIIEKNEDKKSADVIDTYMFSLVSYTLHSYFLGLGDRHLQNIMITDDGAIFHIDFGFILGTEAYPLTATNIKLNSDMLDVIGGSDGSRYNTYLDLCSKGIIILRKYFNMFFILLSQDLKFKEKHIEKFVMSRFQPRQTDNEVISELMAIIRKSNNSYSDYIRDFFTLSHTRKNCSTWIG